jgi:hypothetical protein
MNRSRAECPTCGLPVRIAPAASSEPAYCCAGCALVARIPVDADGNFPVNTALIGALATGFVLFNQALFWGLSLLLAGEGRPDTARVFAWLSVAAGAVGWGMLLVQQVRSRGVRATELLVGALTGGLVICGFVSAGDGRFVPTPATVLGGSLAYLAWAYRGLLFRSFRGRGRQ